MNWLDIILIIANAIIILIGIIMIPVAIVERIKDEYSDMPEVTVGYWLAYIFIGWIIWALPFLVIDKSSGSTVGTITSVDKNFWGTTALYIKSTETNEEKYCIEYNEELVEKADKHFDVANSSLQLSDLTVTVGGQEIVVNNLIKKAKEYNLTFNS